MCGGRVDGLRCSLGFNYLHFLFTILVLKAILNNHLFFSTMSLHFCHVFIRVKLGDYISLDLPSFFSADSLCIINKLGRYAH